MSINSVRHAICSVLFTMFNPVIDSMRGLCACTDFEKVRREVSSRHISLGSFPEAQHVFGSAHIEKVFRLLADENQRLHPPSGRAKRVDITMVDSSVFSAVMRMAWARWRHRHSGTHRVIRIEKEEMDEPIMLVTNCVERNSFSAALIAALLLSRRLGKLPNKRTMEMLRFHAAGMVSKDDLERFIGATATKKQNRSNAPIRTQVTGGIPV